MRAIKLCSFIRVLGPRHSPTIKVPFVHIQTSWSGIWSWRKNVLRKSFLDWDKILWSHWPWEPWDLVKVWKVEPSLNYIWWSDRREEPTDLHHITKTRQLVDAQTQYAVCTFDYNWILIGSHGIRNEAKGSISMTLFYLTKSQLGMGLSVWFALPRSRALMTLSIRSHIFSYGKVSFSSAQRMLVVLL